MYIAYLCDALIASTTAPSNRLVVTFTNYQSQEDFKVKICSVKIVLHAIVHKYKASVPNTIHSRITAYIVHTLCFISKQNRERGTSQINQGYEGTLYQI